MKDKKFELVKENPLILSSGRTFYRIRALRSSINFKRGDIGGYVGREDCLSQDGNCWIYDNSIVGKGCHIKDDAIIKGNSVIDYNTTIRDFSIVLDNSEINNSTISGRSIINKYSKINGSIIINSAITESKVCMLLVENSTLDNSEVTVNQSMYEIYPFYEGTRIKDSYLSLFVYNHKKIDIKDAVVYSIINENNEFNYRTESLVCSFFELLNMNYAIGTLGLKYNYRNDTSINNSLKITWVPKKDTVYIGNELIGCKFRSTRNKFLKMISNNYPIQLDNDIQTTSSEYIKSVLKDWDGFFDVSMPSVTK